MPTWLVNIGRFSLQTRVALIECLGRRNLCYTAARCVGYRSIGVTGSWGRSYRRGVTPV